MKRIEAIIKPFALEDVKDRIQEFGDEVSGMSVVELRCALPKGVVATRSYRNVSFPDVFTPMVKVILVVTDEICEEVTNAICESARTLSGEGCGMIYVSEILGAIRIRTGQRQEEAITAILA